MEQKISLTRDRYSKVNEAIDNITKLGYKVNKINDSEIQFIFNNKKVIYYPVKEWATGASIKDCRGLGKLLGQIKQNVYTVTVEDIRDRVELEIKSIQDKLDKCEDAEYCIRFESCIDSFNFILEFIEGKQ